MKGVVFNLLADVVSRERGEDAWDHLLDAAGLHGAYTSLGNYPEEELTKLVAAAAGQFGLEADQVLRWFGRSVVPRLVERFPQFFRPHRDTVSFLLTLNDIIHPEVRKLYPQAGVPSFDYATAPDGALLMGYTSARRLCEFGAGLIEGTATHYRERLEVTQPQCVARGDPKCVFRVRRTKMPNKYKK